MGARGTLLLTGASGLVGAPLYRHALRRFRVVLLARERRAPPPRRGDRVRACDLLAAGALESAVDELAPQAIVHLAALASLPACEEQPALAQRMNADVTRRLAAAAARHGAHFVLLSTDQVFDGARAGVAGAPPGYVERDAPRPLHAYGRSKVAAEEAALASGGEALVLRAALVLAPSAGGRTGALDFVRGAPAGAEVRLFADEWRTPVSVLDLARLLDAALVRRMTGVLHAGGAQRVDRHELGVLIDAAFPPAPGAPPRRLVRASQAELPGARPRDVSLASERRASEGLPEPRPLADALAELARLAPPPR